jgi:hypothetical protein
MDGAPRWESDDQRSVRVQSRIRTLTRAGLTAGPEVTGPKQISCAAS